MSTSLLIEATSDMELRGITSRLALGLLDTYGALVTVHLG